MEQQVENKTIDLNQIQMEETESTKQIEELTKLLVKNSKKQLLYSRISGICIFVIAVAFVTMVAYLLPAAIHTLNQVNSLLTDVSGTVEVANEAIGEIVKMSDEITGLSTELGTFVEDNSTTLTSIMAEIDAIDFDGLNKAIKDLGDVVEPMAKFFHIF